MVIIKKDVNKMLLFLVLIPIVLFISFSAYYDNKLKNITAEYDKGILKEATGNIVLELNETIQSKEIALKAKESLEQKYSELQSENEGLKSERDKMQTELNSVKSELEQIKFSKLQEQFQQVQDSLIKANGEISRLIARTNELCRKLEENGGNDEKC